MASEQVVDKRCSNCIHVDLNTQDYPCRICVFFSSWDASIAPATPLSADSSVNPINPKHYSCFPIQPLTFITENKLDYLQGNIIKYVCRYPYKGGVEDLKKAQRYLEELIKKEESAYA